LPCTLPRACCWASWASSWSMRSTRTSGSQCTCSRASRRSSPSASPSPQGPLGALRDRHGQLLRHEHAETHARRSIRPDRHHVGPERRFPGSFGHQFPGLAVHDTGTASSHRVLDMPIHRAEPKNLPIIVSPGPYLFPAVEPATRKSFPLTPRTGILIMNIIMLDRLPTFIGPVHALAGPRS